MSIFRYGKNAVVLYKKLDQIVVLHLPQQDNILQDILIQIKQKFSKPLVDGGQNLFSYKRIIEMITLNKELKRDLIYTIDTVSLNFYISQVSRIINKYLRKVAIFLNFTKSNMTEHKKNDQNTLISAFKNSLYAFSYWRIINNYVLSTGFDEKICKEKSPKLKSLLSYQLNNKIFIRIIKEVSTNLDFILDIIKKEFRSEYNYKNYTSKVALLEALNLKIKIISIDLKILNMSSNLL